MMSSKLENINLCIFCGSKKGSNPYFENETRVLGKILAYNKIKIIYGGGGKGLMGIIAETVINNGGFVEGIMPNFFSPPPFKTKLFKLTLVKNMSERKNKLIEISDAFCILPGGIGTLDEFFEIITLKQLKKLNKPIILVNWNGYWNKLIDSMIFLEKNGFSHIPIENLFTTVEQVSEILPILLKEVKHSPI